MTLKTIFGSTTYTAEVRFNDGRALYGSCEDVRSQLGGSSHPPLRPPIATILGMLFPVATNAKTIIIREEWTPPLWSNKLPGQTTIYSTDNGNFFPEDAALIVDCWATDTQVKTQKLIARIMFAVDGIDLTAADANNFVN